MLDLKRFPFSLCHGKLSPIQDKRKKEKYKESPINH